MSTPKKIDSIEKAYKAIEAWRSDPPNAQIRQIKIAIQSIELNQMYFEQKGNEKGALRMEKCIEVLQVRLHEIAIK